MESLEEEQWLVEPFSRVESKLEMTSNSMVIIKTTSRRQLESKLSTKLSIMERLEIMSVF
jgi:hypothetical protein